MTPTDNPMTPEQCREGARKMAEFVGLKESEYHKSQPHDTHLTVEDARFYRDCFDPYNDRNDLAPVLAEIAKRGLWGQFGNTLSTISDEAPDDETYWVPPLVNEQSDLTYTDCAVAMALLAPPHVLASAALATIEGQTK